MLAWTIYISFFGVVVSTLLPRENARAARIVALLTALGGFAIALIGTLQADAGLNTFCDADWVPSLGIHYHLAADGISLTLVLLTGVAAVTGILFSWNIEHALRQGWLASSLEWRLPGLHERVVALEAPTNGVEIIL